jgi:hypothetical protein
MLKLLNLKHHFTDIPLLKYAVYYNWEINFMFRWLCISIQSRKEKPTWRTTYNLVYFVNLYMFRAYLGPSSGGTTVCIQQLVLILFKWLSVVLDGLEQDNRASSKKNKYQLLYPYGVLPDDVPRYAWNT